MIYPTRLTLILFLGTSFLSVPFLTWRPDWWVFSFFLPACVLIACAIDALLCMPQRALEISWASVSRFFIAQKGIFELTLHHPDFSQDLEFECLLELTGEFRKTKSSIQKSSQKKAVFLLELFPLRRGSCFINAVWVRWLGPFRLVEKRLRYTINKKIAVIPDSRSVQSHALQLFLNHSLFGQKIQHLKGEGSEFENLREYTVGMDNRYIDWKHSARHRKLLSKEFRQEQNHQIVLVFDTGHLMLEPIEEQTRLDHCINAALLIGWTSLKNGDLIGAYAFDEKPGLYLEAGRGMPCFTKLQQSLAELSYSNEETNFTLGLAELDSRLKRRAMIIIFTEFIDTISAELLIESLQRLTRRHLVVFVTLRSILVENFINQKPVSSLHVIESVLAGDFQKERAIVLERIKRLGIFVIDSSKEGFSVRLLNQYLAVKQQGIL